MSINGKKVKKFIKISAVLLGITFVGMFGIDLKKKKGSAYEEAPEEKNPMEGKRVIFVEDDSEEENADGVRGDTWKLLPSPITSLPFTTNM